jgi:hypothetical protein
MMDPNPGPVSYALEIARKRRAELTDSILVLARALEAPVPGRAGNWTTLVTACLRQLAADFREHIAVTEGPDGLYQEILTNDPRLSHAVHRLAAEHARICHTLDRLIIEAHRADGNPKRVAQLREAVNALISQLMRHRQRGADLVYEAYETDIGGET